MQAGINGEMVLLDAAPLEVPGVARCDVAGEIDGDRVVTGQAQITSASGKTAIAAF